MVANALLTKRLRSFRVTKRHRIITADNARNPKSPTVTAVGLFSLPVRIAQDTSSAPTVLSVTAGCTMPPAVARSRLGGAPNDGTKCRPPRGRKRKVTTRNKPSVKVPPKELPDDDDGWEASGEGYEQVGSDNGECIDWAETPNFAGIYLGTGEIEKKTTGELFTIHRFSDAKGDSYFAWAAFKLDEALDDLPEGTPVRITWKGKTDLDGSKTLNMFKVFAKVAK